MCALRILCGTVALTWLLFIIPASVQAQDNARSDSSLPAIVYALGLGSCELLNANVSVRTTGIFYADLSGGIALVQSSDFSPDAGPFIKAGGSFRISNEQRFAYITGFSGGVTFVQEHQFGSRVAFVASVLSGPQISIAQHTALYFLFGVRYSRRDYVGEMTIVGLQAGFAWR